MLSGSWGGLARREPLQEVRARQAGGERGERDERALRLDPEGAVEREGAGAEVGQRERTGDQREIELVAALGDEEALRGVDGADRLAHDADRRGRADRREQARREQRAAARLADARGQRGALAGLEPHPLERLAGGGEPVAPEPAEQLLRAVGEHGGADHDAEGGESELHASRSWGVEGLQGGCPKRTAV